jgi:hypothetical protein
MNAAGARGAKPKADEYLRYFGINPKKEEAFVRKRIAMHIQITGMHLIAWDHQPFRTLLDAITNHDPFLMPFFSVLNTVSIDWTSPVKPGHATGKNAWKLVTTYIGDIRDKLANTFRNAGQNWPPRPWMVGGAITPVAPAAAPVVAPTPRVDSTATVVQFFVIDPDVQRPRQQRADPQGGGSNSLRSRSSSHGSNSSTPQPQWGAGGEDSDLEDDTGPSSDEPDSYEWRFPGNRIWIQEFQHHDLSRHGRFTLGPFLAKFLPKIPGGRTIRALYGALGNLANGYGKFVDPGMGATGSIVGLNDDDAFGAWLSITKHLQQPLGIAIILHRNCPPDSPTRGQDLHLDQAGVLAQDLLDEITDYPYDSEGPDANSKSRKRFGKPRSTDGWIKAVNKYGRRVRQNRWVLRRLRDWASTQANGLQPAPPEAPVTMEQVICFPGEACYRPRMNHAQHFAAKQQYIALDRDDRAYRKWEAANPRPPAYPRLVGSDEELSN